MVGVIKVVVVTMKDCGCCVSSGAGGCGCSGSGDGDDKSFGNTIWLFL